MAFSVDINANGHDAEDVKQAVRFINVIISYVRKGGYVEGNRNNIAVDLSCMCKYVGLDVRDVVRDVEQFDFIDLSKRLTVLDSYVDIWDKYDELFDKMLSAWYWETLPEEECVVEINE